MDALNLHFSKKKMFFKISLACEGDTVKLNQDSGYHSVFVWNIKGWMQQTAFAEL